MRVFLDSSVASVAWNLPKALANVVESLSSTVQLLVHASGSESLAVFDLWKRITSTAEVLYVVDVAFVVSISAEAADPHGGSLEVLAIEALCVLLSANVSNLLAQEAFVVASMSAVIVRRPELEVRALFTWRIDSFTLWLVKAAKVNRDHDI